MFTTETSIWFQLAVLSRIILYLINNDNENNSKWTKEKKRINGGKMRAAWKSRKLNMNSSA